MRIRNLVLTVLTALAAASSYADDARAAVDIEWDCYLPSAQVSCGDVESAFFSQSFYARATPDIADARVQLRAVPVADGVKYAIDVATNDSSFSFHDAVPKGFTYDAVVLRIVGDLQKATAPLLVVEQPGTAVDGVLSLSLRDPDVGPRAARADDESTGWYVAPSLNLNIERFGIHYVNANASLELNWSHPDWRLKSYSWAGYRLVVADPVTGDEDPNDLVYESSNWGTDWVVARGFANGFSPAANAYVIHSPQENFDVIVGTWVGLEWVLLPFLKTDEGNFGVHYVIGPEYHRYVFPVKEQRREELYYMRHRARAFGIWHFNAVDLEGSLTGVSHLTDIKFSSVFLYSSITWRVLADLSVQLQGEVSYRNALLSEPFDLEQLHPLEQYFGGASYGDVTYWSSLVVTYTFGNSLLKRQDQRWR